MHSKRLFLALTCLLAMLRLPPASAQLWTTQYHDPNNGSNIAPALVVDHAGNVIVTGWVYHGAAQGYDYTTVKMDGTTGAILWTSSYNGVGSGDDRAYAIAVDSQNNVLVTGNSYGGAASGQDYTTEKIDGATGRVLWVRHWNGQGNGNDYANALAVDSQDNVIVTGTTYAGSARGNDVTTLKYNGATGSLLWARSYNGPASGDDAAAALALDSHDNVLVTGTTYSGPAHGNDFLILKYDATTGNQLWVNRWNETGNWADMARSIAVDHADNVVVTGSGYRGTTLGTSVTTLKMDGATGLFLWARHYDGPGSGNDSGAVVKVDSQNNVVVLGDWINPQSAPELVTLKYDPSGNMLWKSLYGSPGSKPSAFPFALAIDSQDNVVVCGNNYYQAGHSDWITLKYKGTTGAAVWSQVWSQHDGSPLAIGLDSQDNVFVVGSASLGMGQSYDYLTVKYAP